jgi:hypothetical protein
LPVGEEVRTWHASPRSAVGFLTHAGSIDLASLGSRRSLMMPGISATVGEQIEALRRVAGEAAVRLIRREPDATMSAMFKTIPGRFDTNRGRSLDSRRRLRLIPSSMPISRTNCGSAWRRSFARLVAGGTGTGTHLARHVPRK